MHARKLTIPATISVGIVSLLPFLAPFLIFVEPLGYIIIICLIGTALCCLGVAGIIFHRIEDQLPKMGLIAEFLSEIFPWWPHLRPIPAWILRVDTHNS